MDLEKRRKTPLFVFAPDADRGFTGVWTIYETIIFK